MSVIQAGTTIVVSWTSVYALTYKVSLIGVGVPPSILHTPETRAIFYGIKSNLPYNIRVIPINSVCEGDGMIMRLRLSGNLVRNAVACTIVSCCAVHATLYRVFANSLQYSIY